MTPTWNSLFAALCLLAPLTSGLVFSGPRATGLRNGDEAQTELATAPMETAAPDIKHAELFKRDHYEPLLIAPDNTCGYYNGNASSYYSCDRIYRCFYYLSFYSTESTSAGVVACCPTTGSCDVQYVTKCIDSEAYAVGATCSDDRCVECTSSAFPHCKGATFPALGIKDFVCGLTSFSTYVTASLTYLNQFPARVFTTSSYLVTDLSTSTPSTPSTSPTTTPQPASPTPTQPVSTGSGTPIGPIVGGVVGGVAVIAGIIALIWFMRRRRKRQANNQQPSPHVQLQQFPPPADPKTPYAQTSPVQPPYYQQHQPGYEQPVPYNQQQPGQQYSPVHKYAQGQQYNSYSAEQDTLSEVAGSPLTSFGKTPTDTIATNRFSQAPTVPNSPYPITQHSPNPQHSPRQEPIEIEG